MEISLTPELQRFIEERVASGQFESAEDVICGALSLLKQQDELTQEDIAELREDVAIAIDQLDRGEGEEWDAEKIKDKLRDRVQKAKRVS